MLEVGACMELKAKSGELMEAEDSEVPDISFEELLAQEKKDSFWLVTCQVPRPVVLSFGDFVNIFSLLDPLAGRKRRNQNQAQTN